MNNAPNRYEEASLCAERFLAEQDITSLPINPIAIASSLGIDVYPKSPKSTGASGILIRVGNQFAIAYATHIQSEGFQRFSIGHEVGHYLLPGHPEAVLSSAGIHESFAGYRSDDPYEKEADNFAAGLLMPQRLFLEELRKTEPGLEAIEDLASTCGTSLSATAIRYARYADYPVAIVTSIGPYLDYCLMSSAFKELPGIEWLKKKQPVPRNSHTCRFNQDPSRIKNGERTQGVSTIPEWFGSGPDYEIVEEVVGLGEYGRTLTVLRPMIPEDVELDEEEQEDEARLIDSWTPRFYK